MKLRQHLQLINELVKENPEVLDMEVIHASDPEGNEYHKILRAPGMGVFTEFQHGTGDYTLTGTPEHADAVCIN